MTEETAQIGDAVTADVKQPVDTGGGGSTDDNVFIESGDGIKIPNNNMHALTSDSEEGFLSTSPDSVNGSDAVASTSKINQQQQQNSNNTAITAVDTFNKSNQCINNVSMPPPPISLCTNPAHCVTLQNILDSFKAPLSEEQAWALLYQFTSLYRNIAATGAKHIFSELEIPDSMDNMCLHRDGTVHCKWSDAERRQREQHAREERLQQSSEEEQADDHHVLLIQSHKKILTKVAICVYTALDHNLQSDEQCNMSQELEELITLMTGGETDEDCIDEGIDEGYKRWDEESDETKEFDIVLEACKNHIKPTVPDEHYKAVCRALVTETIELRIFLQQVLTDGAESFRQKADTQTTKQELAKLGFHEWARFWVQVIDELRRGVRLKKSTYSRTPTEYELTPYEILMEDIRSKKYQLRKVMVNGDIPPRVKKDAHAVILEFIRSRPPLKKASERKLAPPVKRTPSPREQLMDSIRKGQTLKHISPPPITQTYKHHLLPPSQHSSTIDNSHDSLDALKLQENQEPNTTPRSKQRLIKVDFSLLQDDDTFFDETLTSITSTSSRNERTVSVGMCSQPQMPPYPIGGYMTMTQCNTAQNKAAALTQGSTRALRRTTYDLATQCESRRSSLRRHTIVGCQSNFDETHSMPPTRPESRQSDINSNETTDVVSTTKQLHNSYNQQLKRSQSPSDKSRMSGDNNPICPWNKSFLDEKTWQERGEDRLSLTLEEIVHIRSVMTKAELEGLPVGVRIKEDVEKRKVCFLCLRTRFSIFGPWGIQCKLCQRTVCSKCYTKMRIPSEHFRNVPLVLVSPSLLASPSGSNTPSPSHQAHQQYVASTGNVAEDTFPKTLIERLLRTESDRKARSSVGSAPSSPKHQRSNMSTPGIGVAAPAAGQAVEALHDSAIMTSSYTAGLQNTTHSNISSHHTSSSSLIANGSYSGVCVNTGSASGTRITPHNKHINIMSRSMEGPRSLPVNSPARSTHSTCSTLDRRSKFSRFTLSGSGTQLSQEHKENVRGEQVPVCNDCRGLVMEITRSSKKTRSSERNRTLKNLTLDLSPVYK